MNTKQVEELTGISRQNIRYYERMGLLHPARNESNSYREYTKDDVKQLQTIKMLRMLDLPIEDILIVLEKGTMKEALKNQRAVLQEKRKELQAAMEMCDRIGKAENPEQNVEQYVKEMEYLQSKTGGFAQVYNDYKQVALAMRQRQFSFYVYRKVQKEQEIFEEITRYAKENGVKIERTGRHPLTIQMGEIEYRVSIMHTPMFKERIPSTIVICTMSNPAQAVDARIPHERRKVLQEIYEVCRSIRRQKWKSMLVIAICMMAVCFMESFVGNVESHKRQLAKLPEVYEIASEVRNPGGTLDKGIIISEKLATAIRTSPYIEAYKETIELNGICDQGGQDTPDLSIQGVNQLDAVIGLKKEQIIWQEGMDSKRFIEGINGCIVDSEYMRKKGWQLGESIQIQPQYYDILPKNESFLFLVNLEPITVKIIGSAVLTDCTMVCPIKEVKEWFRKSNSEYRLSSVSCSLKKPYEINAYKKQMKQAGFKEVNNRATMSYKGSTLVVEDVDYIAAATSLRKSIGFLTGFYSFLLTLILVMGYMVSWLLLQSRQMEVAIMKSLGKDNLHIARQLFAEHSILAILGCIIGILVSLVCAWGDLPNILMVSGLFFVCYSIGTMISLWMIRKFSVMAMLSAKE